MTMHQARKMLYNSWLKQYQGKTNGLSPSGHRAMGFILDRATDPQKVINEEMDRAMRDAKQSNPGQLQIVVPKGTPVKLLNAPKGTRVTRKVITETVGEVRVRTNKGRKKATRRKNPGKVGFYKIWFSSPTEGETAGLIVDTTKYPKGKTSISTYSRLFPMSEARKMKKFHTSKIYDTWNEAFAHSKSKRSNAGRYKQSNPRLRGWEAIEFAEKYGRKTVSKYADAVSRARKYVSLDDAREIAREDPNLIYLDANVGVRKAIRKKRTNAGRYELGQGYYNRGKSKNPASHKTLGPYKEYATAQEKAIRLKEQKDGKNILISKGRGGWYISYTIYTNPAKRKTTKRVSKDSRHGVYVGPTLAYVSTKKLDANKAVTQLRKMGKTGIKQKLVKPNPVSGKLPVIGWRQVFKKRASTRKASRKRVVRAR